MRVHDVPLPVPVMCKDGVHGLEWHSLGFGQEASNEDGHGDHPCSVEEEYGILEVVEQGEEDLGLHREDEGDRQCDGLRHGPDVNEFSTSLHLEPR
jgi:hypothetical protein